MDYHNKKEALKEALLDIEEGADIIMVKPALSYHDVISEAAKLVRVPLAAYSVSGEYAMVKAAAKAGFINESDIIMRNGSRRISCRCKYLYNILCCRACRVYP